MKLIVSAVICAVMFALGFQAAGAPIPQKVNALPQYYVRMPKFRFRLDKTGRPLLAADQIDLVNELGSSTCEENHFARFIKVTPTVSSDQSVPENLEGPADGEQLPPNVTHFVLAVTCDPASKMAPMKMPRPAKTATPRIVQPAASNASS